MKITNYDLLFANRGFQISNLKLKILAALIFSFALALNANAQIAAGGQFKLEQSAIASGGSQNAAGGQFALDGTTGQAVAGQTATAAPFDTHAGFWFPSALAPTAAGVSVGGQITTTEGQGIRNVVVTLVEADGTPHSTLSGKFGNYRFADVAAGQTVVISVKAKRFQFAAATRVLNLTEDSSDNDFVALGSIEIIPN